MPCQEHHAERVKSDLGAPQHFGVLQIDCDHASGGLDGAFVADEGSSPVCIERHAVRGRAHIPCGDDFELVRMGSLAAEDELAEQYRVRAGEAVQGDGIDSDSGVSQGEAFR